MSLSTLWYKVRDKAHVIFPVISAALVVLILASPFMGGPLAFMHQMAFVRFCMFWCLAVCIVLTKCGKPQHPAAVASVSTAISIVVTIILYQIYLAVIGHPDSVGPFFFSCLSGSILGALAGTWGIYVAEMYVGGRR